MIKNKNIFNDFGNNFRLLSLSIIFLTLFFLTWCSINPKIIMSKEPRIEFLKLNYNFGSIKEGTVVKHLFFFTNSGSGVLKITKVSSP